MDEKDADAAIEEAVSAGCLERHPTNPVLLTITETGLQWLLDAAMGRVEPTITHLRRLHVLEAYAVNVVIGAIRGTLVTDPNPN